MAELSERKLLAQLLAAGRSSPFFELVSALERLFPERPPLGKLGPFDEEAVHFKHDPALAFATADVRDVRLDQAATHVIVTTSFLGITGATSPLPLYFAEEVVQEDAERSHKGAFLDLFHHRLISLLYRALSDLSYPRAYEQTGGDPISECLVSLTGLLPGHADEDGFLRMLHLRYASLLLSQPGSTEALEVALSDALEAELGAATVRVACFAGDRVALADDLLSRLGENTRLGGAFVLGSRVRDRASKLRIHIGPLDTAAYHRMLPGAPGFERARRVVEAILREPIAYELELELAAGCGKGFRLSKDRLGQMTWLGESPAGARVRIAGGSPRAA